MKTQFDTLLRDLRSPVERRRAEVSQGPRLRPENTRRLSIALGNALIAAVMTISMTSVRIVLAQNTGPAAGKTSTENSAPTSGVIPDAWPVNVQIGCLADIGRHKAVIFSPDFAERGNRAFYEKLGFLYMEDASWQRALNQIIARNYWHPENRIETIFLETHGTNGNGLKLQTGPSPRAARSYISIGGLQEKLDDLGVRLCVIGACNAGRLFRPEIYKALDPKTRDPLFLPATLGIINATREYDSSHSKMIVVRRAESEIETTSDGDTSELSPSARTVLGLDQPGRGRKPRDLHFVVSNLLIQMLIRDPRLKLTATGYASEKSRKDLTDDESEALFQRFVSYIDDVAAREYRIAQAGSLRAASTNGRQTVTEPRTSRAATTRVKKRSPRRVID